MGTPMPAFAHPNLKSRDRFSPCHYYSKWATTSTDTAGDNVIQRIPGITMSETNNTTRRIPMTEEGKRNLEEVLFNNLGVWDWIF